MKFTRQDTLSVGLAGLLIGFFTDILIRQDILGLNFLIWTSIWSVLILVTAFYKKKLSVTIYSLTFIALTHSFLVYIRSEPIVQFWSFVITLVIMAILSGHLTVSNFSSLPLLKKTGEIIASFVLSITLGYRSLFRSLGLRHKKTNVSPGIVVALILAFIFILLFSGSDEVFRHSFSWFGTLLGSVSDFINDLSLGRFYTILICTLISVTLICLLLLDTRTVDDSEIKLAIRIKRKDAIVILGTVLAIFVFYLAIQAQYLFAGADLPEGLTYANYARRGYGELLMATLLASAVIQLVIASVKDKKSQLVNLIGGLLVVANSLVILSAWKRLQLYESAYGFTMARFVAKLGLICLAIGSVLLILWIMGYLRTKRLFALGWLTILVVLTISSLINPSGLIVKQNITERSRREVPLDTRYILTLSRDSWPSLCTHAVSLKKDYPEEYRLLVNNTNSEENGVEFELKTEPMNSGLSAHYTKSSTYSNAYKSCLE